MCAECALIQSIWCSGLIAVACVAAAKPLIFDCGFACLPKPKEGRAGAKEQDRIGSSECMRQTTDRERKQKEKREI
jgi:hypothetical protein